MECTQCSNKGCSECAERGRFVITQCPYEFVGGKTFELLHYADLYEKGIAPVEGGALDQDKAFVDATRFWMAEKSGVKRELGIKG